MKKMITVLAICSLLLSACGQVDDTESKPVTTASESSAEADTTETSSSKEEKDTSEATTTIKSSQTVSETSKPTGTTVTTTKKSNSSGSSGNSGQGQNNSVQNNNYQPVQNDPQPDNSPSDNNRSNNGAEQNNRPSDNKPQKNDSTPPTTTAKPAVTNPPTTTTTKPQTESPAPEPDDQVVNMDALTDQVWVFIEYYPIDFNNMYEKGKTFGGSDFDKAVSILEYANDLGGRNCIEYALNAYFLYQGAGLECGIIFASLDEWYGHVANVVKIDGTWYEFDASARKYTENLYYVVKAFDIYENEIIVK